MPPTFVPLPSLTPDPTFGKNSEVTWNAHDKETGAALAAVASALPGAQRHLTRVIASLSAAPAGPLELDIWDGPASTGQRIGGCQVATELRIIDLNFETRPLHGTAATDMTFTLTSPAGSVVAEIDAYGYSTKAATDVLVQG